MPRKRLWDLIRMTLGSILGIIGFGTLSLAFVRLSSAGLAVGLVEILLGAFLALGVMTPLRKQRSRPQ